MANLKFLFITLLAVNYIAANEVTIKEEDYDKIFDFANMVCACSEHKLEQTKCSLPPPFNQTDGVLNTNVNQFCEAFTIIKDKHDGTSPTEPTSVVITKTTSDGPGGSTTKPTPAAPTNSTSDGPGGPTTKPTPAAPTNATTVKPGTEPAAPKEVDEKGGKAGEFTNSEDPNKYSLATLLIILFCSFGAGLLVAFASKKGYDHYKTRSFVIPPEQDIPI